MLLILFDNLAVWSTSTLNADHATVPFLPANPFLSATRNQVSITRKTGSQFELLLNRDFDLYYRVVRSWHASIVLNLPVC